MLTVVEFAEAIGKPRSTVSDWLTAGIIKGAELEEFGKVKYWKIPADAVKTFAPPKRGRPRKDAKKK